VKKISKIIDILKSKWLRDTGKTIILIAIIVALFIGINILVSNIDPKDIDLTKNQLYTLSEETKERIQALPESDKIQIYMFDFDEQAILVDLIKQYERINENISVEVVKVQDRPDLASKYNVEAGYFTIIIVNGEKSKMYTTNDFYSYDSIAGQEVDITEQRMTSGIISVSSIGQITPVYALTGHEEINTKSLMFYFSTYLELENYELKTLDLLSAGDVPEDCKVLMIASPKKDFTEKETNAIKAYIEKGKNILWLNDPYSAKEEMPNVKSILDMYGVNIRQDGIVTEQDKEKMLYESPNLIFPRVNNTSITDKIEQVLLLYTGKLEFADNIDDLGVVRTDILTTSENSFFRTDIENTSRTPVDGETVGASVVGAILEKYVGEEGKSSKLIVYANNTFAADTAVYSTSSARAAIAFYQNKDLIINSVQYAAEIEDPITIRKTVNSTMYTATLTQDRIIKYIIFGFPVLIIGAGIVVWQLRRRKQ